MENKKKIGIVALLLILSVAFVIIAIPFPIKAVDPPIVETQTPTTYDYTYIFIKTFPVLHAENITVSMRLEAYNATLFVHMDAVDKDNNVFNVENLDACIRFDNGTVQTIAKLNGTYTFSYPINLLAER